MSELATPITFLPGLSSLQSSELRRQVTDTWTGAWELSGLGDRIHDVPFTSTAPDEPLIVHVNRVVEVAGALEAYAAGAGFPAIDHDVLIGSCLLHDVDKVCLLQPAEGGGWEPTRWSRRYQHGHLGAMLCRDHGVPEEIVHLVATHTTQSCVVPEPFEGVVLHYADLFVADAALYAAGAPLLMAPHPR
jgi:putative nucleotidyltransferase with HDIG domain